MGVLISIQFKVQTINARQPNKQGDLMALIKNLETEKDKLQEDLRVTRDRLNDLEQKRNQGEGPKKELAQHLLDAKVEAGLLPMKGPGITVRLADSQRRAGPDEDNHYFIVHDVDLQTVVNELWAAGAEA